MDKNITDVYNMLNEIHSLYSWGGLILTIIFVVLNFAVFYYLRSYFTANAESKFKRSLTELKASLISDIVQQFLNQKEDIDRDIEKLKGEINKDIDSHFLNQKGGIDKELQLIQSRLDIKSDLKTSLILQKKESIIALFVSYSNWLYTMTNSTYISLVGESEETVNEHKIKIEKTQLEFEISKSRFELFNELSNEQTTLIFNIHKTTVEYQTLTYLILVNKKHFYKELSILEESYKGEDKLEKEYDKLFNKFYEREKAKLEEITNIYSNNIIPLKKKFKDELFKLINTLSENNDFIDN